MCFELAVITPIESIDPQFTLVLMESPKFYNRPKHYKFLGPCTVWWSQQASWIANKVHRDLGSRRCLPDPPDLWPQNFLFFKNSLLLGVCWKCFKNQIRIFPQFKQFLLNILWYPYTFISAVLMKGIIMNCYLSRSNSPTFVNLTFLWWILDCIGCGLFNIWHNKAP